MISLIVPIYNKEKYIKNCIESLISQTYKDIEILLIDDGSTDSSLKICNSYKIKDDRIKVYSKKNGGVSSARNYGLNKMSGEKVLFVDADDYIEEDYVDTLNQYEEDFVVCSYLINENGIETKGISGNLTKTDKNDIYLTCLGKKYYSLMVGPCTKLFKSKIIKDNKISFDESMNFGEDTCFVLEYIKRINSMKIIPYFGYHNVIIPGTLSRRYIKNINEQLHKLYQKIKNTNEIIDENLIYYWYFRNMKLVMYNEKNQKFNQFKQKIGTEVNNEDFKKITLTNSFLSITDKLIFVLLKLRLYYIIYLLYKIK